MIKVICDKCGKDCGRNAIDISMGIVHNPSPFNLRDESSLKITDDKLRLRFILCQSCSRELTLPNIYETLSTGILTFK